MGSPPPDGSKNEVLKLRSVSSIVIAPARTGRASSRRMAVIRTDQTNRGMLSMVVVSDRILIIVVMKLIAPRIEDAPAKCSLKIPRSTLILLWNIWSESGGYTVHPVPTPAPAKEDMHNSDKEGGRSQNLMLFIRGNAMSGAPIMRGTSQLPKPPIITGMTIKKIITKACAVTTVL